MTLFGDVVDAIAQEKQLKRWSRRKKDAFIVKLNPNLILNAVSFLLRNTDRSFLRTNLIRTEKSD